jgi:DNA (cytosine-5)-methyltransferase 1
LVDADSAELRREGEVMTRKLSIAEAKRLCSFPDDYELTGTYQQQWARLGNSVPPLMTKAVAEALAPRLLTREPSTH